MILQPGDPVRDSIYASDIASAAMRSASEALDSIVRLSKCVQFSNLADDLDDWQDKHRYAELSEKGAVEREGLAAVAERWERAQDHGRTTALDDLLVAVVQARSALDVLVAANQLVQRADMLDEEANDG